MMVAGTHVAAATDMAVARNHTAAKEDDTPLPQQQSHMLEVAGILASKEQHPYESSALTLHRKHP